MSLTVVPLLPREGVFRDILRGIHRYAAQHKWALVPPRMFALGRPAAGPDAVVVTRESFAAIPPALRRARLIVSVVDDLSGEGICSVAVDDPAVGRMAAEHLVQRGPGVFGAYGVGAHAQERARAFRDAVVAHGGSFHGWGEGDLLPARDHGVAEVTKWLRAATWPMGVLACSDADGEVLLAMCRELGINVPDDVAVISADNDELVCEMSRPALSSVGIPWQRIGQEAAAVLEQLSRGGSPRDLLRLVRPEGVHNRQSCDHWGTRDSRVRAAMAYIRAHVGDLIAVADVVRGTGTNRRDLERRFRVARGRTIMQEIRRAHLGEARRLLRTTGLPISQVAQQSGFSSQQRLSEAFQRELHLSPREFRLRGQ